MFVTCAALLSALRGRISCNLAALSLRRRGAGIPKALRGDEEAQQ